jgi:uncharacterized membrane protein YphA (DoxX/SURF4 family)
MPLRLKVSGSRAVILIRLMVGIVFLSKGIQKFLLPSGAGGEVSSKEERISQWHAPCSLIWRVRKKMRTPRAARHKSTGC